MSSLENENRLEGIAIIGMSGKFPGAPDLDTFWANVAAGKDTITRFSRAELEARDRASLEFGPDYVAAHGVLEGVELFDAGFFGIPPREADSLDPQHRLFLESCRNALEDGGYDPAQFSGQIGVFGGCSLNTYLLANLSANREFLDELTGNYQVGEFQAALGNDKDFLCTRVAYKLNLRGPCLTVQAACATSLVAVCQASQSWLEASRSPSRSIADTSIRKAAWGRKMGVAGHSTPMRRAQSSDTAWVWCCSSGSKMRLPTATGSTP